VCWFQHSNKRFSSSVFAFVQFIIRFDLTRKMDLSTSAAHKRISMIGTKRNSVNGVPTMTREQAMAVRKFDPEIEEIKNAEVSLAPEMSPARNLPSPPPAKRSSLPDLRKSGSKGKVNNVEVVEKRNSVPGISFQTSLNLSDKYSVGEVILVTLSDGRPMCGEISSLENDILVMEYAEGKQLLRALIEVQTDKRTGKPTGDLVSLLEMPARN
jgi:hypothetical protein